jgi:hypothetical protein
MMKIWRMKRDEMYAKKVIARNAQFNMFVDFKNEKARIKQIKKMKIWRIKRDEMHAKKVIARKNEKARIKQIKKMKK